MIAYDADTIKELEAEVARLRLLLASIADLAEAKQANALREAVEPLLRFHETGGHEGDGSDERLALIRAQFKEPTHD